MNVAWFGNSSSLFIGGMSANVESTLLTVARTGQYSSGLRKGFPVTPSIGLSVQF